MATSANEFAGVVHMQRRLGLLVATEISQLLGLPEADESFVTPAGRVVTGLCDRSETGGFSSSQWSLQGWVLDNISMNALMSEFPEHFRRRITSKSKPPAAYR